MADFCLYEVNEALKLAIGKDLLSNILALARDESKTELEVKQFLKENYPWEGMSTQKERRLATDHVKAYLQFYRDNLIEVEDSEVTYASGCCECCLHEERDRYRSKGMILHGESVGGFFD